MFNFLCFSKYSTDNKVITDEGFIGIIEAKRRDRCGDIEYLVVSSDYSTDHGKYRWIREDDIADKLSNSQAYLFSKIFNGIKGAKDDSQWRIKNLKDTVEELTNINIKIHRRLNELEKDTKQTLTGGAALEFLKKDGVSNESL